MICVVSTDHRGGRSEPWSGHPEGVAQWLRWVLAENAGSSHSTNGEILLRPCEVAFQVAQDPSTDDESSSSSRGRSSSTTSNSIKIMPMGGGRESHRLVGGSSMCELLETLLGSGLDAIQLETCNLPCDLAPKVGRLLGTGSSSSGRSQEGEKLRRTANHGLKVLQIVDDEMDLCHFEMVQQILASGDNLEELELVETQFRESTDTDQCVRALAKGLKETTSTKLRTLRFCQPCYPDHYLTGNHLVVLIGGILRSTNVSDSLETLDISHQFSCLWPVLGVWEGLGRLLFQAKALRRLLLRDVFPSVLPPVASLCRGQFFKALSHHRSLVELNLMDNAQSDAFVVRLVEALTRIPTLRRLAIGSSRRTPTAGLTSLGLQCLWNFLPGCNLETLEVHHGRFLPTDVLSLAATLEHPSTPVKNLSLVEQDPRVSQNPASGLRKAWSALFQALCSNHSLRVLGLKLSRGKLPWKSLRDALRCNATLVELSIHSSFSSRQQKGVEDFLASLSEWKGLQKLSLPCYLPSTASWKCIVRGLRVNRRLRCMKFRFGCFQGYEGPIFRWIYPQFPWKEKLWLELNLWLRLNRYRYILSAASITMEKSKGREETSRLSPSIITQLIAKDLKFEEDSILTFSVIYRLLVESHGQLDAIYSLQP